MTFSETSHFGKRPTITMSKTVCREHACYPATLILETVTMRWKVTPGDLPPTNRR